MIADAHFRDDIARLQDAQDGMLAARGRLDVALEESWPADVVELYAATRATVRRLQHELGLDERVRRQLRLRPLRRAPTRSSIRRRSTTDAPERTGPEEETQVLPPLSEEPPEKP